METSTLEKPETETEELSLEPSILEDIKGLYLKLETDEDFDDSGMKMTARYFNMPLSLMHDDESFQRGWEPPREKKIIDSINLNGRVWPFTQFIIDENFIKLDGKHRTGAMLKTGSTVAPEVVQLEFVNIEAKVDFFLRLNSYDIRVNKPLYVWRAKKLANHTTANLLYKLCNEDTSSLLYNYVGIHGKSSLKNRVSINIAWHIIAKCGLNRIVKYERNLDTYLETLINTNSYEDIKSRINDFLTWFKLCFGEKNVGNEEWATKIIAAYLIVYKILLNSKLITSRRNYNSSINKFKKFQLSKEATRLDVYGITEAILSYYNYKTKNENLKASFPQQKDRQLK